MAIRPGTHTLGPQDGELLVHTRRSGAAAKAGHDLVIEVGSWSGTLEIPDDPGQSSVAVHAEGDSLRVREGSGGIQALGEGDKDDIKETIDKEVLRGGAIEFRSTAVQADPDGERLHVRGGLELVGRTGPVEFELRLAEGRLTGAATVKQSDWGIKPYSALFGALKVADEVVVTIDAGVAG